ncbi:MAG: alpha/beta fold hydrolase [Candidatus Lokiarchaeota archaeon]|nr:alpha/beta fold hydrolase [Candidatus Lokiarchaeota archaeon]
MNVIRNHVIEANMTDVQVLATEFTSKGETIRGNFVLPTTKGPFPGVCKFHGLPGGPDQVSGVATRLAEAGFAVLVFDFRGFRKSDGLFSLSGEIADAKVAITHLMQSDFASDSWVGVYGASYGAAVAVCTAAYDKRIDTVVLRAPVYDTLWFAKSPMIQPAVENIIKTDPSQINRIEDPKIRKRILQRMIDDAKIHNPMDEIAKVSPIPLLIIHGAQDTAIDLAGVKKLYERGGEPKEFILVEGADHELSDNTAYERTVHSVVKWFLKQWRNT